MTSQPRASETRLAILSVARRLFTEHGVEATSVEDIRAQAFISRGAFYHHFGSKEEVLLALATEHGPRLQEEFEALIRCDASTPELAAATLGLFTRGVTSMPRGVARSLIRELTRAWTVEGGVPPGLRVNLEVILARGAARGEMPPGWRLDDLAGVLFGTTYASLVEWLALPGAVPADLDALLQRRCAAILAPTPRTDG